MSDRSPQKRLLITLCALLAIGATACGSGAKRATTEPEPAAQVDAAPAAVTEPAPTPQGPGVVLRIDHPDAEVFVDGERVGVASDLEGKGWFIALEAGIHQIAVRKPGFNTWRVEVAVRDKPETIEVTLEPAAGQ